MYQQADTHNPLGKRRWTSGLQGYLTSEALARRMPAQSARAPAGWTGLGTVPMPPPGSIPVGSPPYPAPPGLMWVWQLTSSGMMTAVYPPAPMKMWYAWHLQKGPGYSPSVLAEYYRQNPSYIARDSVDYAPGSFHPASVLVTPPSPPPVVVTPAATEVSLIEKIKAWLAEETIMPGYANQWFVVGGALAYFLLRKKK